jgi:hypothetical protein
MDDDEFREIYDSALERGVANLEILALAAAWCQNIGQTNGPLGVGELQLATGLPITGGSLRCDYAKAPTRFGHSLVESSVEFYEANCIGCPHRKPTAATEHLGTYADAVIAERTEQERLAEQERLEAVEALRGRREDRRARFGSPDPTGQSILDLIDRVDGEERDEEAEGLLLRHAEMASSDFSDELLAHLTDEAIAIGNSPLLEAIVAIFERDGRPGAGRMLEIAFTGLAAGVGRTACGRVIAAHATSLPADEATLRAVVVLAAGRSDFFGGTDWIGEEPAALLRLFDLDQARVTGILNLMLTDEDRWVRATAAHAAERLLAARPAGLPLLLDTILDAAVLPDSSGYLGEPFASHAARGLVADFLVADPVAVSAEIDRRMAGADVKTARNYWKCYDLAAPSRFREEPAPEAHRLIAARAVVLLADDTLDPEMQREVADTLTSLCECRPGDVGVSVDDVLGLMLRAALRYERFRAAPAAPPPGGTEEEALLGFFAWESERIKLQGVFQELKDCLEALARADVPAFVDNVVGTSWAATSPSPLVRSFLLELLGKVIRQQPELDRAAPIVAEAIDGRDHLERAEAVEAVGEFARHDLTLPAGFTESVIKAIGDEYLIIVLAAVRAIGRIDVEVDKRLELCETLLNFARVYGNERIHTDDVRRALWTVHQLATDQPFEGGAEAAILTVISGFLSEVAVQVLEHLRVDHDQASWPATIVGALKPDPDPQWNWIHQSARLDLLRQLAETDPLRMDPLLDEFEAIGKQRLPHDRHWAWAVADVLARLGAHARAAAVCDAVVDGMPNTTELRLQRAFARQIGFEHHLNDAVSRDDEAGMAKCIEEWARGSAELRPDG